MNVLPPIAASADQGWSFWTAMLGAVVGSASAGGISYFLAWQSLREARAQRERAKTDAERASVVRVMLKLMRIATSLDSLHRQSEASISGSRATGGERPLWTMMSPIIGLGRRIEFDTDDISVFVPMNEAQFMLEMISLDDRHDSILEMYINYGEKRAALVSEIGGSVSGHLAFIELTLAQMERLAPRIADIDCLASSCREHAAANLDEAKRILTAFGPKVQSYFRDPNFLVPKIVTDEERTKN